jgi:DNA repair ATPase RecN
MAKFTDHDQMIEMYADSIAQELYDMPSFDLESIKTKVKTRLNFAVRDLYQFNVSDSEKYRREILQEYLHLETPNWRKEELKKELTRLKDEIKDSNRIITAINHSNEYELLKKYCKENMPEEFLLKYYELQKQL